MVRPIALALPAPVAGSEAGAGDGPVDIHDPRPGAQEEQADQAPRGGSQPAVEQKPAADTDDHGRNEFDPDPERETERTAREPAAPRGLVGPGRSALACLTQSSIWIFERG